MRFLLLVLFLCSGAAVYAQPTPEYHYLDRYAHPHISNFSAQIKFGLTALHSSGCAIHEAKQQNYYFNPNVSLGVGYQFTHYIQLLARASYFTYHCEGSAAGVEGIKGSNFEGILGIKHYLFPIREFDNYLSKFNFYGMAGVGALRINPKKLNDGTPYAETRNFNQLAMVVPVGIGIEYKLNNFFLIALEGNYNFTNTGSLDMDFSTGGDVSDHYVNLGVNITYRLPQGGFNYQDHLQLKNKPE